MSEYEVKSITKPNRLSPHEHITHIGNNSTAPCWRMTREKAIKWIDEKIAQFYTVDTQTGQKIYLYVVREQGKNPYLRSAADGKWRDNLLALADCNQFCQLI
jgi:hypothetical protein